MCVAYAPRYLRPPGPSRRAPSSRRRAGCLAAARNCPASHRRDQRGTLHPVLPKSPLWEQEQERDVRRCGMRGGCCGLPSTTRLQVLCSSFSVTHAGSCWLFCRHGATGVGVTISSRTCPPALYTPTGTTGIVSEGFAASEELVELPAAFRDDLRRPSLNSLSSISAFAVLAALEWTFTPLALMSCFISAMFKAFMSTPTSFTFDGRLSRS
jgi:hypothetical protein